MTCHDAKHMSGDFVGGNLGWRIVAPSAILYAVVVVPDCRFSATTKTESNFALYALSSKAIYLRPQEHVSSQVL